MHLLTRKVKIIAYKRLNIWYIPPKPQLERLSFWALILKENRGVVELGHVSHFYSVPSD